MKFACLFRGSWQFFRQTFIRGNSIIIIMQIRETDIYTSTLTTTKRKKKFLQNCMFVCIVFRKSLFLDWILYVAISFSFLIRVTHCCFCWMSIFFAVVFVRSVVVCENNLLLPLHPRLPRTRCLLCSIPFHLLIYWQWMYGWAWCAFVFVCSR